MTSPAGSEDLRRKLVIAGIEELRENGVAAVSIRAVARRVGVSHASPGYVFGDRAGLLTAMAEHGFDLLRDHLAAVVNTNTTGADAVTEIGEAYLDFARRDGAVYQLLFDADELRRDDPDLASSGAGAYAALIQALPHRDGLGPLLAWGIVHGLAGLERSGALGAQFPGEKGARDAERQVLQRVAQLVSTTTP